MTKEEEKQEAVTDTHRLMSAMLANEADFLEFLRGAIAQQTATVEKMQVSAAALKDKTEKGSQR